MALFSRDSGVLLSDDGLLERLGVCRVRVDAEVDLAGWEEELSKVTPLSIFAEDGSYAQYRNILEESDFPFGSILETIAPILEKNFVDSVNELRLDDAFAIHYSEQHRDTTVNLHTDPSDITVNLCLGRSADLEGSEVLFHGKERLKQGEDDKNTGEYSRFRVGAIAGYATIHWGRHPHEVTTLVKGSRTNVVLTYVFIDTTKSTAQCAGCYVTDASL